MSEQNLNKSKDKLRRAGPVARYGLKYMRGVFGAVATTKATRFSTPPANTIVLSK